jgi:hypothetical protein
MEAQLWLQEYNKQLARESKPICQITKPRAYHKIAPLLQSMIREMELAGFTHPLRDGKTMSIMYKIDRFEQKRVI